MPKTIAKGMTKNPNNCQRRRGDTQICWRRRATISTPGLSGLFFTLPPTTHGTKQAETSEVIRQGIVGILVKFFHGGVATSCERVFHVCVVSYFVSMKANNGEFFSRKRAM